MRQALESIAGFAGNVAAHWRAWSRNTSPETAQGQQVLRLDQILKALEARYSTDPDPPAPARNNPFTPLDVLNAEAASAIYSTAQLSDGEIRLVTLRPGSEAEPLRCDLDVVGLSAATSYTALSYVCKARILSNGADEQEYVKITTDYRDVGGSQADPACITLNGCPYRITRNLETALLQLRKDHDVLVWVDALAINQTDKQERSNQVSIMRDIFSRATKTLVSLDPSQDDGTVLVLSLLWYIQADESWAAKLPLQPPAKWLERALIAFGELAYWARVWVIQEVAFSHQVDILHQGVQVPYTSVKGWEILQEHIKTRPHTLGLGSGEVVDVFFRSAELSVFMDYHGPSSLPVAGTGFEFNIDLLEWVFYVTYKKATDPRDIVFGFHGCFPPQVRNALSVDYTAAPDQVWTDIARLIIQQTGQLDIILISLRRQRTLPGIPSWVPQWSADQAVLVTGSGFCKKKSLSRAASGSLQAVCAFDASGRMLQAQGYEIGTVENLAHAWIVDHERLVDNRALIAWLKAASFKDMAEYFRRVCRELDPAAGSAGLEELFSAFSVGRDGLALQAADNAAEADIMVSDGSLWECLLSLDHLGRRITSFYPAVAVDREGESGIGYCLGPAAAAPGDKLCVLLGCSAPVVLREVDSHCELLGDVYIPGCMKGEVVDGSGKYKGLPRKFSIR
jgi:hypothetical protein